MKAAALRQKYGDFRVPRFELTIGSQTIEETDGRVSKLKVDTTVDGADHVSITLSPRFDRKQGSFTDHDWSDIEVGTSVSAKLGYTNAKEPVFTGKVTKVNPTFPKDGLPSVTVTGYGLLHELSRGSKNRSWDEVTHSDVADEVAGEYSFDDTDIDETGVTHPKVFQQGQSDLALLRGLAKKNGFQCYARRRTFIFKPPAYRSDPVASLSYEGALTTFTPEYSLADDVGTVEVRHWDPSKKKEIVGTAERDIGSGTEIVRRPVRSADEAEQVASGILSEIADGTVSGRGETVGIPEIVAGNTLELSGLGSRYSKTYYVTKATHTVSSTEYRTSFDVKERKIS